jgi:eukaryotic-like serine/threonine-protein kinase
MSDQRWQRIEQLFHEAAELAPFERAEFLSRVCSDDSELRRQVESLLANDKSKDDVLQAAVAKAVDQLPTLSPGSRLGPYEILAPIGAGGMGEVWKARDTRLNRTVAIKVSPGNFSQRFEREAHAIAALNHPNICQIHDVGPDYLVLEYIDGKPLTGPLPVGETIRLAIQIAGALEEAHSRGILHRDLKPANILVTPNGTAKLLDFGLAKLTPERTGAKARLASHLATDEMLTTPGQTMGTVAYMSPEQARGEELDARTDLWSFGAVLYEMATGVRPFRGDSSAVVFKAILDATPTPAVRLNPDVPAELERVIDKALEKDRKLRYQSAADMRTDLERLKRNSESHKVPEMARRARWPRAAATAAILLAAVGAAYYFFVRRPAPKLTDKDTIVLADFANTTGDPVFDGTLRQGLSAQLAQSPFLNLLSDQRISQTLALMSQPKDARLTEQLGRDVCQRTASAATIEGTISSLGTQYVLGLKAVNCRTGDVLAQEQATANGKEQVLKGLGDAATKLREKLGESLVSVEKYDVPPENVTTSSLEALQAYSRGYQAQVVKGDSAAAIPFFERAVSLDPNFAMGYARLGTVYSNVDEITRGAENTRKAYELRGRTSEQERFYISASYQNSVTGNLEAARATYELWAHTYPSDDTPLVNLGNIYINFGEYLKALAAAREELKLDPGSAIAYGRVVYAYRNLNRLDEAQATAREARAHNLDGPGVHSGLYYVSFLQHDAVGMDHEAAMLMGMPGHQEATLSDQSDTAAYGGEFAKARELTHRAVDFARRADLAETEANENAHAAMREAWVGNMALAKREAQAALALANGMYVEAYSAVALGLAGDSAQAARLADDLGKRFPENTYARFEYLPMIHATIALQSGDAGKAVQALAEAKLYELGLWHLYPVYLRGEAYLAAKQGAAAEAEFQKILDHPGVVINEVIGALAHLGLGRAYALSGDRAKAKTAYQDFFALWKNADPDIPILQRAKAEYAKLK